MIPGTLLCDLGPDLRDPYLPDDLDVLRHCVEMADPDGVAVEFGVGSGRSTRLIAENLPVIGFDSFEGLPEDWRPEFPAGSLKFEMPDTIWNATLVVGLFADTLPEYRWPRHISLVHFDADLYSSTATALDAIGDHCRPGTIFVFDEFFGYIDDLTSPGETGERRAFREYAARTGLTWNVIGHGREQWAIQLKGKNT